MQRNERSLTGLKLRYYLDMLGAEGLVNFLDAYVPRGEMPAEARFITPEELDELNELRGSTMTPDQTYGQYYNKIFTGKVSPRRTRNNKYEDPTLQRIDELSRLQGARLTRSGGRKATRRRRQRVRQTRRK